MSKDFKTFLQQFSEKMQDAHEQRNFSQMELDSLDETINGLLSVADRVYADDVQVLLQQHGILDGMEDMRATIEGHLCNIGNLAFDHQEQKMKIFYNAREFTVPLVELPDALNKYFNVMTMTPEFDFFTAYLARNDNYDIIQIYGFLRTLIQ